MSSARPGLLRQARLQRGIGVRDLGRRMGVTPGAVSQWERSDVAGTIRSSTLEKALAAMGTSVAELTPKWATTQLERREDRVALELHKAVAKKLIDDPQLVLSHVPDNIARLRARVSGEAVTSLLDLWETLTSAHELGSLLDVMLGADTLSINMRQTSPFSGVLSEDERLAAIRRAQK
jgi:transcriptional regulator with XRE-family HTH domain